VMDDQHNMVARKTGPSVSMITEDDIEPLLIQGR
jgi:hypothetical protein